MMTAWKPLIGKEWGWSQPVAWRRVAASPVASSAPGLRKGCKMQGEWQGEPSLGEEGYPSAT
jgi:hypothetical protein